MKMVSRALILAGVVALAACNKSPAPTENAAGNMMENATESLENQANQLTETAGNAANAVENATDNMMNAASNAAGAMKDAATK